jgi:protein-disulfide isomerase
MVARSALGAFLATACLTACHGQAPQKAATTEPTPKVPLPVTDPNWEHTRTPHNVPVGDSPVLGKPDAPVTIVEFADFQCASCLAVQPTLDALRAKYGDAIRLVWKNDPAPFLPAAEPAAEAALEVRNEKGDAAFWAVHRRLFERHADLAVDGGAALDVLAAIASEAGADRGKVIGAIRGHAHREGIEADRDLAEDLDEKGSLHFFVNGRRLEGAAPLPRFERMIDEELANARTRIAEGIAPAALYDTIIAKGRGAQPPAERDIPPSLPANDPALGVATARVTVHVFSDYQCPLCLAVERAMDEAREEYRDEVRFVWHDLPLARHAGARLVAEAGREAYRQRGAAGFWALHDKVFRSPHDVARADLDAFAADLKLDPSRWMHAFDDGGAAARAMASDEKAAAEGGITETPAYLVVPARRSRGYFVAATEESERLHRAIERALDVEREIPAHEVR